MSLVVVYSGCIQKHANLTILNIHLIPCVRIIIIIYPTIQFKKNIEKNYMYGNKQILEKL